MAEAKEEGSTLESLLDYDVPPIPVLGAQFGYDMSPFDDAFLPKTGPCGEPLGERYGDRVKWIFYLKVKDIENLRTEQTEVVRILMRRRGEGGKAVWFVDPTILPTTAELREKYVVTNYKGVELVLFRYGGNDFCKDNWFVEQREITKKVLDDYKALR